MIGEKCEYCGDKVLILKKVEGKNLCLDCYCEFKNKNMAHPKNNQYYDSRYTFYENKTSSSPLHMSKNEDRRCPNCGRIIPFDSILCPYCGKRFESFL